MKFYQRLLIVLGLFIFGAFIMFGLMCYLSFYGLPINFSYSEEVTFIREYIGNDYCENCLIIKAKQFNCLEPHLPDTCKWENKTYFFSGENKLKEFNEGDCLKINWKWIYSIKEYRIRGVNLC
jgi:hypothetical protein